MHLLSFLNGVFATLLTQLAVMFISSIIIIIRRNKKK
jgi:hypothetical protein